MDILSYISDQFHIRRELVQFVFECEEDVKPVFRTLQETAQLGQFRVKMCIRDRVYIVGSAAEAEKVPFLEAALVVAQTTITHRLWDEVVSALKTRIRQLDLFNSICDTTQKRQKEAVELARASDIVLVVGGRHSSNTEKLYQLCRRHCEKTYYIDNIARCV